MYGFCICIYIYVYTYTCGLFGYGFTGCVRVLTLCGRRGCGFFVFCVVGGLAVLVQSRDKTPLCEKDCCAARRV